MKVRGLLFLAALAATAWGQSPFPRPAKRAPGAVPPLTPGLTGLDVLHGAVDQLGRDGLPAVDFQALAKSLRLTPFQSNDWGRGRGAWPAKAEIRLSPAEMLEVARLSIEAVRIGADARREQVRRQRELAARGVAEVPASTAACRYNLDLGGMGRLVFDVWGECQVDRRFVKSADLQVLGRLETLYRKAFASSAYAHAPAKPRPADRPAAPTSVGFPSEGEGEVLEAAASLSPVSRLESNRRRRVPVFRGFEDARYQRHDALIVRLTREFNANKALWIGGTAAQAARVADLTPALVKSHMIEETGGNGPMSLAAWPVDPEQVNVPGDWSDVKLGLGLSKPTRRNEGTAEGNVRAAIKFLARKGFGRSGQPAARRPDGFFDGWTVALRRYNARRDRTVDNRHYSDAYADKIRQRAEHPETFVPIEIRLAPARP